MLSNVRAMPRGTIGTFEVRPDPEATSMMTEMFGRFVSSAGDAFKVSYLDPQSDRYREGAKPSSVLNLPVTVGKNLKAFLSHNSWAHPIQLVQMIQGAFIPLFESRSSHPQCLFYEPSFYGNLWANDIPIGIQPLDKTASLDPQLPNKFRFRN